MILSTKKSQVAATFTWFTGFLIIFFLIFLFLIASLGLAAQKTIAGKLGNVELAGKESSLILTEQAIAFLNTHVEVDGNKKTMRDLILESLEVFNNPEGEKFLERVENINNLYQWNNIGLAGVIGEEKYNLFTAKNNIIIEKTKEILSLFCKEYALKIPQGTITNGQQIQFNSAMLFGQDANYAIIKILYLKYLIEIKYKQKC